LGISFDEWNFGYRARSSATDWKIAPPLLEEYYNHEDALVCAQYLNAFFAMRSGEDRLHRAMVGSRWC